MVHSEASTPVSQQRVQALVPQDYPAHPSKFVNKYSKLQGDVFTSKCIGRYFGAFCSKEVTLFIILWGTPLDAYRSLCLATCHAVSVGRRTLLPPLQPQDVVLGEIRSFKISLEVVFGPTHKYTRYTHTVICLSADW